MYRDLYVNQITNTLSKHNVMAFIMGARQVGKTTLSKLVAQNFDQYKYFNWDNDNHRSLILSGQGFIEKIFPPHAVGNKPLIIFDEIHKYTNWKNFIKGFYDTYKDSYNIIVTGSSHLNIFQKGGDSLMGRYIPYTLHPFSLGELNSNKIDNLYRKSCDVGQDVFDNLYQFGGFPSPFLKNDLKWYNQWRRTRRSQLFREDIRDLTNVHEISNLELCAQILEYQTGSIFNRSTIAKKIQVNIQTINRWVEILKQFYFAFPIYPWKNNIPHSLVKEPKIYLHDWSLINDPGARFENFVACHLKKSIDFWSEIGIDEFNLHFLRDKRQREVDFLVSRSGRPWLLIETKTSQQQISSSLLYYQKQTNAPIALQVTKNMPYIDHNCFEKEGCFIVPANTFLSQLI